MGFLRFLMWVFENHACVSSSFYSMEDGENLERELMNVVPLMRRVVNLVGDTLGLTKENLVEFVFKLFYWEFGILIFQKLSFFR